MEKLFIFTFDSGNIIFFNVGPYDAQWSSKPDDWYFTKASLTSALQYLINICYFQVGSLLFRQKIGIPMGSSPAPFLANLFLFYHEKEWIANNDRNRLGISSTHLDT
jgi:hypothetical protein